MQVTVGLPDEEATRRLGRCFGEKAVPGLLVLLFGELGAGKTVFAQGMAEGLESATPASSPTFNLIHLHEGRLPLLHADLYRLDDPGSVEDLGIEELLDSGCVGVVEWPELAVDLLRGERVEVRLTLAEPGRRAVISSVGEGPEAVLREVMGAYTQS